MSTGDLKGCIRKLEALLRVIKYPRDVDYNGLSRGDPTAFLPLVSFALTSFSPMLTAHLVASGLELTAKTDLRFTDTLYKLLRDMFQYKPILSKQQFLQFGFSERKISVTCDVINLVLQKHNQLKKSKPRLPSTHSDSRVETFPLQIDAHTTLTDRPYVVSHIGDPSLYLRETPAEKCFPEPPLSQPDNILLVVGQTDKEDHNVASVLVEGRLAVLEAQLQGLVSGVKRLTSLERRVEELESWRTCKDEGETITVSRKIWDNLLSRVLLLETKLELTSTQMSTVRRGRDLMITESQLNCDSSSLPHPPSISTGGHTAQRGNPVWLTTNQEGNLASPEKVNPPDVFLRQEDLTGTLERINNMMKNTSSLLKNGEASL